MGHVAFVGLGSMGRPMAARLAGAQHRLLAWDVMETARDQTRRDAPDVNIAQDFAHAVTDANALILMVVNARQAADVYEQAAELLVAGAVVVLMATCGPSETVELAARVDAAGHRFVDAPVSGGVVGAQAGTLTIMVGASAETFAVARPVLAAMGDKIFHVGETPGAGAAMKTVNQLLAGVHIAAAAEALALAAKAGIDPAIALPILTGSAASSWMLNNRGPRMLQALDGDDAPVTSAVDIFVKDLGLVLDAGRAAGAMTPLAALSHQLFLAASANGLGKADDSAVVTIIDRLNGR